MINHLHRLRGFVPVRLKCSALLSVWGACLPPGSLSLTSCPLRGSWQNLVWDALPLLTGLVPGSTVCRAPLPPELAGLG